jgi:hypothetical protein
MHGKYNPGVVIRAFPSIIPLPWQDGNGFRKQKREAF